MTSDHTNSAGLAGPSTPSDQNLRQRFWRLALFNIASNLTVPLTGLVDTAMLGWLPEIKFLAGVALASLIFDYLYFGLGFLRMSTTGQTAQAVGRNVSSVPVLWRSLTIAVAVACCVLLLQSWIESLSFSLLSGAPEVEQAGRDYFRARIWGAPGAICQLALVGWLLGKERSGGVLAVMTTANLTNIGLNWVLIVELGLQARGAGLATAIAQTVGAVMAGLLVWRALNKDRPAYLGALKLGPLIDLFRLNAQLLVRTLLLVTCFALFTDASARLGTVVLAANAILLRWVTLLSYLVDGIAYATETLSGRLWGARQSAALQKLLLHSLIAGSLLSALVWLPMALIPRPIVEIFTADPAVVDYAVSMSRWLIPLGIFGALAYVFDGFYLGATQGARLLVAMVISAGTAIAMLMLATQTSNHHLLWGALVILMIFRAVTLGVTVPSLLRRL